MGGQGAAGTEKKGQHRLQGAGQGLVSEVVLDPGESERH